jgi:hypothetical protein
MTNTLTWGIGRCGGQNHQPGGGAQLGGQTIGCIFFA